MIVAIECNADETFVVALFPKSRDYIRHFRGRSPIITRITEEETVSGIGIVDEDPQSNNLPRYFNDAYVQSESFGSVKRYVHRNKSACSLIMLCPRLEEWLLARAKAAGIDRAAYGLPDTGKSLHEIMHYERRPEFKEFLERLFNSGDVEVEKLRGWIANSLFDELLNPLHPRYPL
ncbi:MAG: hypothetical protein AB2L13_09795 [Spirochaetota bacterium]|jgi:hypothetical protein